MNRLYCILVLMFMAVIVQAGDNDRIEQLIQTLGAGSFTERKEAAEALRVIGEPAREALEKAAGSSDPEVSMTARQVLQDLIAGVDPSWPLAIQEKVRGFDKLSEAGRKELIASLAGEYRTGALPFLFFQIEKGEKETAQAAAQQITGMEDKQTTWTKVLQRYRHPENIYEGQLLACAAQWSSDPDDIALALGSEHIEQTQKSALLEAAVKSVRALYESAECDKALKSAESFAKGAADEARLLYLQALSLAGLDGDDKRISELAERALALNPENERSHYTSGEMLMDLRCYGLAEKEWNRILEIPPKDDVYDLNAYLRLGTVYAQAGKYALAAQALETVSAKYKIAKEKHGSSMGMVGIDALPGMIERYKKLAAGQKPADSNSVGLLKLTIDGIVKDEKGDELKNALKKADASMTSNVEPYGFRLFEKAPAGIRYDKIKQELSVTLNGSNCAEPEKFVLKADSAIVAVNSLDMTYMFKISRDAADAEKISSYERDYTLTIEPGEEMRSWKNLVIEVNGKECSLEDLAKGIPYDYLPQTLSLDIKGDLENGEEVHLKPELKAADLMERINNTEGPAVINLSIESSRQDR